MTETYELAFRRLLNLALAAHGRKAASPAHAERCYIMGLSAGEAAAMLAPFQELSDDATRTFGAFVGAAQLQEGAR